MDAFFKENIEIANNLMLIILSNLSKIQKVFLEIEKGEREVDQEVELAKVKNEDGDNWAVGELVGEYEQIQNQTMESFKKEDIENNHQGALEVLQKMEEQFRLFNRQNGEIPRAANEL